ncbi:hypothetical protein [Flavilitoribacter nigricans]|uniref:Uncharacterized protein n=1 Tax=Flavilitoribacter nigricans (strain ATCC 23147 / DSM 23189 / NBRC 102662 / NCIMB 1420 / SS-2) TaxID=1122177 RepID=A0A2D0MWL9_FLAN2|nr:hypothetical protein [Flavilitoribacter nigricans]PHN00635.1 hypothetical protein CRP01_41240 [Flavilitoribacter nigricans DSM 23189 = NBRC 102662]
MKSVLEKIAKDVVQMTLVRARVIAVYDQAIDVTPINDDADILDVKIRVVIDENEAGVMILPPIGSIVLVGLISDTDAYLLSCSEVERMVVNTGKFRFEVDSEGNAIFDQGENEGLVKLPDLRTEIDKLNSFLNTIKQTFSSWTPVPNDGGSALKAAMSSALSSEQLADLSEVGNDKIKH